MTQLQKEISSAAANGFKCDTFEAQVKGNYICITFPQKIYLTGEIVNKLIDARIEISNGKSYSVLVDFRNIKGMNKEAREISSGKKAAELVDVAAVLIKGMLQITLINFIVKFNKSPVKTKMFGNKEEALKWLINYDSSAET